MVLESIVRPFCKQSMKPFIYPARAITRVLQWAVSHRISRSCHFLVMCKYTTTGYFLRIVIIGGSRQHPSLLENECQRRGTLEPRKYSYQERYHSRWVAPYCSSQVPHWRVGKWLPFLPPLGVNPSIQAYSPSNFLRIKLSKSNFGASYNNTQFSRGTGNFPAGLVPHSHHSQPRQLPRILQDDRYGAHQDTRYSSTRRTRGYAMGSSFSVAAFALSIDLPRLACHLWLPQYQTPVV